MIEFSNFDQMEWTAKGKMETLDAFLDHRNETFSTTGEDGEIFLDVSSIGPPPDGYFELVLDREVSEKDIENLDMEKMPGFKLTWSCNKNISGNSGLFLKDEFVR